MLAALILITPLGLAGAVSPVMLSEQTVILAGRDGRRAAAQYAAGVVVAALAAVLAVLFLGHSVALPQRPHLDASLDVVVGVVLLLVAGVVRALGARRSEPRPPAHHARAALPFGVFSMATNPTTLALLVPAAKAIAAADVPVPGRVALVVLVVSLVSAPAWVPVVLTRLVPGPGERVLAVVGDLVARRGRQAVLALLVVSGLFFVIRGVVRLTA